MEKITVEIDPLTEAVYNKNQISELASQLETARTNAKTFKDKNNDLNVLIRQCIKVSKLVDQVVPGVMKGNGFANFSPISLMTDPKMKEKLMAIAPEAKKMDDLIQQYLKTNPL